MDKVTFVKNFALNREVGIAGKFIYDGMHDLNCMYGYNDLDNIFGFLYKISVGIERLQKIAYILLKNPNEDEYKEIEEEIITHSHTGLQDKINDLTNIFLNDHQKAFLHLLTRFYNSCRYDRFNFMTSFNMEQELFINYVQERLNINIDFKSIFPTMLEERVKKFLGKVIGNLAKSYYKIIHQEADKIGIYTHELDALSKSMKIFANTSERDSLQEQMINEQIAFKELLIFLLNTSQSSSFYDFLKSIPALDIDIAMNQEYLCELVKEEVPQQLIDELEDLYLNGNFDKKERFEMLSCIGNPHCHFYSEEDEEGFEQYDAVENNEN